MDHASRVPDLSFHLLNEITDGFSPDRILGIGAFGKVYRGEQNDGKQIAVKVLHDMIALDDKQFINEYNNLTKLQHHNIVRLVGYCQENRKKYVNYEGRLVLADEIKRALCFEYLHNGSLDKYIFDEYHGQDWNTRYVIIKGICEGLKYLHEDLEAPMYHLDLKPANILLSENMEPKIADFGLSRLFGEEKTRTTTSSIGTFGYLPPEYIERNIISNKLDIFSLGVIVIKIMAGRSGYDKSFDMHPQQFVQLVLENWRNRLQKPTDFEEVKRCIEIALRCVEVDRDRRPTIGEIVHNLSETETVIHNLFPQGPYSLCFLSSLKTPIYTKLDIIAEGNKAIRIGIFGGDNMITEGPLSKVKVEMLVLRGDFSYDDREIWTEEEFKSHIVESRHGQGFLLGGDCSVWLKNGEASFGRIVFKEGSARTHSRKFVIAARVCMSEKINVRVQEAVMEAYTVLDRRSTVYEKKHLIKLTDGVHCLEGITKDGTYHTRLCKANIATVQDLLMALNKDENKLCKEVLRLKKQHSSFLEMVKHARECTLGDDQIDRAKKDGTWDKLMHS